MPIFFDNVFLRQCLLWLPRTLSSAAAAVTAVELICYSVHEGSLLPVGQCLTSFV